MEVDVGDKEGPVKGADGLSVALFNVTVAHVFTDDAAVFAFDESVVVGAAGTGLGLFDEEFIEERGDDGVDELAAIVGVEPFEDERERGESFLKGGQEELFADGLNTDNDFPLGNGINKVDVIDAFFLVGVSLMDGVDANPAGLTLGIGAATDADGDMNGFGAGKGLGSSFVFF